MSKPTTIELAPAGHLPLNVQKEFIKLPTEAIHNHLHRLVEETRQTREKLEHMELAGIILCGLELQHRQMVNHGSPWKEWVKSNCECSHKTVTKYIKVLTCARAGQIKNLDPSLIPDTPPSEMSKTQMQDACNSLANALTGLGGIRQLYLQLEIIKAPTKKTIHENRNDKGTNKSETEEIDLNNPDAAINLEREDATNDLPGILAPLNDYLTQGRHQHLTKPTLKTLDAKLQTARDILKPFLKS